ncbi:MAG: hypothetical protein ACR2MG_14810 [Pyrinomonadaceae bacterium]
MNSEERVGKAERRIKTVEDAIILLTVLTDSHNDRLETLLKDDENLNAKISALIDAQISSEDQIQSINEALDKLTALVKIAHQRLDILEK